MKKFTLFILAISLVLHLSHNSWAREDPKAQESRVDTLSQFYQANQSYREGNYQKAAEEYENILKSGWESGPLYYNLGNSYFKAGQLGAAILNYERAKRLIPRDSDLEANHKYAVSLTKQFEGKSAQSVGEKMVSQYCDSMTLDEVTVILFCLFCFMGIHYLAGLFWKWPRRPVVYFLVILVLLFTIHSMVFVTKWQEANTLAVVMKESSAKFEPRVDATTHFELGVGWKVKILQEEDDWIKIERKDGKTGWVKNEQLTRI